MMLQFDQALKYCLQLHVHYKPDMGAASALSEAFYLISGSAGGGGGEIERG